MNSVNSLQPKIAVLLAAYNGLSYLPQQVESILAQKEVELTLFVSVDSSSDGTEQWFDRLAENDSKVVLLPYGRHFGGAAKNFFRLLLDVDFSDFGYVAFADQDDIWQEDKLSHAVKIIKENNVDAYSSNVTAFWPNGREKLINKAQAQQQYDFMFESAGPGCTFVLTKKLALTLQDFLIKNQEKCKKITFHDWFIYAFARSRGYKWLIDKAPKMYYRQHDDNVVGANVGLKAKLARSKKLLDGWFLDQALLIADILGYSNALPIQKLRRYAFVDRVWLILNTCKLRRRLRDRLAFTLFFIFTIKNRIAR